MKTFTTTYLCDFQAMIGHAIEHGYTFEAETRESGLYVITYTGGW